ncbi:MAG: ABC transporter substrate-binding protein [Clostridia bacterium]|nr:ABC transporter substrate-binding protein [Clostridia bacterium]
MKKVFSLLLGAVLTVTLLAGCVGTKPYEAVDIRITAIAGPTGVGLVELMQKQADGKAGNNYTFDVVTAPDQAVASIANGTADMAAVPTNLASALYKKTGGKVQVLALNTLGVLHVLTNGEDVSSVYDLKGKTIYTSGKGANPEYILRYVLEHNGVNPDTDVKIEFVADNDTLGTLVANGTAKVALVPEPKASAVMVQNKDVKRALNMSDEWSKVNKSGVPLTMGCVVARKEFVEQNPEAVRMFLQEYRASIANVQADVERAATLCETYKIIPKAAIAKAAIPNCGLTYVEGALMYTQLSGYLSILNGYNPAAIGGVLPAEDFYYVQ